MDDISPDEVIGMKSERRIRRRHLLQATTAVAAGSVLRALFPSCAWAASAVGPLNPRRVRYVSVRAVKEVTASLTWINILQTSGSSLAGMLPLMRYRTRMSEHGPPQGLRGFARVAMGVAGAVFLLNTALFPCCEVAAAVPGGHVEGGSQSTSAAPPHHDSEAQHSEPAHHGPDLPCDNSLVSGPALVGEFEALTPDRSPLAWSAVDAPIVTSHNSAGVPPIIALARASPSRSLRFYLRTQRLLI